MSTRTTSIFKDPNVVTHLSHLHGKYVIVPADNAPNNIVFECKSHCIDRLIKNLGIDNPTYSPTKNSGQSLVCFLFLWNIYIYNIYIYIKVGQIYCMVVTCLDVCIIYFISCDCMMNSSSSYTIY